jgi:hypothetical protein
LHVFGDGVHEVDFSLFLRGAFNLPPAHRLWRGLWVVEQRQKVLSGGGYRILLVCLRCCGDLLESIP